MESFDPFDLGPPMTEERWKIQSQLNSSEKLELGLELGDIGKVTLEASIRYRHPEYTEEPVVHARNRCLWGDELFRRACPNAPLLSI